VVQVVARSCHADAQLFRRFSYRVAGGKRFGHPHFCGSQAEAV
jgi:hypothetical protein